MKMAIITPLLNPISLIFTFVIAKRIAHLHSKLLVTTLYLLLSFDSLSRDKSLNHYLNRSLNDQKSFFSCYLTFFLLSGLTFALVPGALLHLDASDNPGHNKSWTNLGLSGGELLAADEAPVLEEGTIEIPALGISKVKAKYYTAKKSLQTFGGPVDNNPEIPVEDWTLEFLCKRNGSLFKEHHQFSGFQNSPREGKQGIRLWMDDDLTLTIAINGAGGKQFKPLNIKLKAGVWTWIALVGTNKQSIISYQDGKQVSKLPGFDFNKKWVLNDISIGANSHAERRRTFNGSFAIVRVYDKALTETQITENISSTFAVESAGKLSIIWAKVKDEL